MGLASALILDGKSDIGVRGLWLAFNAGATAQFILLALAVMREDW